MRCGKCKHQWHATAPLITLQADDLNGAKGSGVSKASPSTSPESTDLGKTGLPNKGVGQQAIAGSTASSSAAPADEPPAKSSFTQTSYAQAALDEEDALLSSVSSMPPYSSEMAPIARRNAIIAAVLLASLLSIPIFMINRGAPSEQPAVHVDDKKVETVHHEEKPVEKKQDRDIVLDGTPTTLLKEEVGRTVLSIEGALINKTQKTLPVPILQAQALNAKGKVVKEWIIPIANKEMNAGERLPFSYAMPFSEQGVVDIAFHFL